MHINWFTVIAQVINFLLLAWLLKRFLYKPILQAIDDREKKIVGQLEDAKNKEAEATKEKEEFRNKNEEFDPHKSELTTKANEEAQKLRQDLLEGARKEAETLRMKLENSMKESQQNFNIVVTQKVQDEVFAISRKIMTDMASANLEEQFVNAFLKRLNQLSIIEKEQLIKSFKSNSNPIHVRSAFELDPKLQDQIRQTVNNILDTKTLFEFKSSPEVISGIELETNGFKLAWSISSYLDEFQKNISETMGEKTLSG